MRYIVLNPEPYTNPDTFRVFKGRGQRQVGQQVVTSASGCTVYRSLNTESRDFGILGWNLLELPGNYKGMTLLSVLISALPHGLSGS